ncbi:MAG: threonylcarbamoyl-AMP synthase [Treponema sp.]|jgi:L-threonylcarbamoyladenylate synthase|nr:threonylcarbamoyl-AMP synthase [Treponema sp.]
MLRLGTSPEDLERAAEIIRGGGIAAFPTETVYGLGASAFNPRALARVFEIKNRPRFDPLILHIADPAFLDRIACLSVLDPRRRRIQESLAAAFWPGPLTLILPKRPEVPGLLTAGLSTVAVRLPDHPAAQALIALSGGAVAAPSANPFGCLSPTRAGHVIEGLGDRIDCLVDGGPCSVGLESTVLDLSSPLPRILRPGGISREALETKAGTAVEGDTDPEKTEIVPGAVPSPGMLKSHYAPETPLFLHGPEEMAALPRRVREGYLFFSGKSRTAWEKKNPPAKAAGGQGGGMYGGAEILVLSEDGAIREAAAELFDHLHRLDRAGLYRIHAETFPGEGLGVAANDRLRRAAAK